MTLADADGQVDRATLQAFALGLAASGDSDLAVAVQAVRRPADMGQLP